MIDALFCMIFAPQIQVVADDQLSYF
jgi:hypothetical protein